MDLVDLYVAEDTNANRKGVAFRKNECLRAFKNYDHIFLFDDDCFPIKDEWINFFVQTPYEHLLFCLEKLHGESKVKEDLKLFNSCGGVFMYMKKSAVEKVGAFNEKFGLYGCEHAEYSMRIMGEETYPVLKNTEEYIYAIDYYDWKAHSSISNIEKTNSINGALNLFRNKDLIKTYLPL